MAVSNATSLPQAIACVMFIHMKRLKTTAELLETEIEKNIYIKIDRYLK